MHQSPISEEARVDYRICDFFRGRVNVDPIKFDFEIVASLVLDIEAYLEVAGRGRNHDFWFLGLILMKIAI